MSVKMIRAAMGGGGIVNPFTAWSVVADETPGNSCTASLTVNSDGSVSGLATPNDGGSVPGTASWFLPNIAGIGTNYFVRITPTSGTFTANPASSFMALSSSRTVTRVNPTGTNTVTFTIEISTDAGGTNIVFTSTGNILRTQHTL